jgi:hypothetical protein
MNKITIKNKKTGRKITLTKRGGWKKQKYPKYA